VGGEKILGVLNTKKEEDQKKKNMDSLEKIDLARASIEGKVLWERAKKGIRESQREMGGRDGDDEGKERGN